MKIQKSTLYMIGILILIVLAAYFFVSTDAPQQIIGNTTGSEGEAQIVTLSIKDYNYYPNTVTVKAGVPVRVYLDSSVSGCLRDFTIRDFGVRKYLATPSDYVEFTPTEKGRYAFACSMGMGTGTLIVE